MKKLLATCLMCFITINTFAQTNKIAVINFKANVGISQDDVDGISSIFTTYFSPQGWTLIERTQIDNIIREQGFQKSSMTESQMVRVGKILNLKKIVIGDVNIISGSYNVDVRIVDVETGAISAKDGATWSGTSYRSLMQSLATRLASKIAITQTASSSTATSTTSTSAATTPKQVVAPTSSATSVITLYGYLKIHPKNLGVFTSEPTTVISNLNKNGDYGYDTWRIPTKEEWELILSNTSQVSGVSASQPYMTTYNRSDGQQKVVRLVTTDTKTVAQKEAEKQEAARQAAIARQEAERKAEVARQEAERKKQEEAARRAAEQQRQIDQELNNYYANKTWNTGELFLVTTVDKFCGAGMVIYVDNTKTHGLIISLENIKNDYGDFDWDASVSNLSYAAKPANSYYANCRWRVPTISELQYIYSNLSTINKNLSALPNIYTYFKALSINFNIEPITNNLYWSNQELTYSNGEEGAYLVSMSNGQIYHDYKSAGRIARYVMSF